MNASAIATVCVLRREVATRSIRLPHCCWSQNHIRVAFLPVLPRATFIDTLRLLGEDSSFQDIPSLVEHKRRLEAQGKTYNEREKAGFFIEHIKQDLRKDVKKLTRNIKGLFTGDTAAGPEAEEENEDLESNNSTSKRNRLRKRKSKSAFYFGGRPSYLEVSDNDDEGGEGEGEGEEEEIQDDYPNAHVKGVFSPIPSPSKMTVNPMLAKPPPPQQQQQQQYKQRVAAFYQKYNPSKMDALPEILQKYQGKEEELLRKLHKQYNIAYMDSPPAIVAASV